MYRERPASVDRERDAGSEVPRLLPAPSAWDQLPQQLVSTLPGSCADPHTRWQVTGRAECLPSRHKVISCDSCLRRAENYRSSEAELNFAGIFDSSPTR